MDMHNKYDDFSEPTPPSSPQPGGAPIPPVPAPTIQYVNIPVEKKGSGSGWRIFVNILLTFSILTNIVLFLAVTGLVMTLLVSSGGTENFAETTLIKGPAASKIAVINLVGIIEGSQSEEIRLLTEEALRSPDIRAIILRINSPGGTVSASDQIHYYIKKLRQETGLPVLAFMQSVAASGGYYSAVACDYIMAEPTAITGSIGVIMSHIVVKDLLEQKLGIQPEVLKSGEKKDWPSMFSEMTDEQKRYLNEKLINPAYERFVTLVCEGRQTLTSQQVRALADGSIYTAQEAQIKGLIDDTGYFEQAVAKAKDMAGISSARVVELERRTTWMDVLGAESRQSVINTKTLEKLAIPQLMYMWDGMH
ncbi:MAG TPA: signal peptide peptidase SppA [Anaerohalosphaeraceae bacterium]|nr:signal peptide peptidase SppA [Anaerohalosphaeraceae bacterium]